MTTKIKMISEDSKSSFEDSLNKEVKNAIMWETFKVLDCSSYFRYIILVRYNDDK